MSPQSLPEYQARHKPIFAISLQNRTLELTRDGMGFVVLIFGVGLGAINTGNNLLYLILAMCCSLIAVSGILSEATLRDISIESKMQKTVYARESSPLSVRVTNNKNKLPSYSLLIDLTQDQSGKCRIDHPIYFFHVPRNGQMEKSAMLTVFKRGSLEIKACRVSTSFPFGFFIKSKNIPLDLEITVFPAIRKVELPNSTGSSMEGGGTIKQRGEELYSLREFRPGDPLGSVHWKSTAKTGVMRVKEYSSGGHQSFTVFLNTRNPADNQPVAPDILEDRVSEAASLVYNLIRRGDEVSLKTQDYLSAFGNSPAHLESLMKYLAFVGMEPNRENPRT